MSKKLLFLHIPKTAGQSVHRYLLDGFSEQNVCPYRVDAQYDNGNVDPNLYTVHSGHIDWSRLEKLNGDKVVFTILRKPMDRLLSFYFYLRSEAERIGSSELQKPERTGLRAALEFSPDEYFVDATGGIRKFIDDHYDNFYSYYFAGKSYASRSNLIHLDEQALLRRAVQNLMTIDGVYTISNWASLGQLLSSNFKSYTFKDKQYHINKGDTKSLEERLTALSDLGASARTFTRLEDMCHVDNALYNLVESFSQLSTNSAESAPTSDRSELLHSN